MKRFISFIVLLTLIVSGSMYIVKSQDLEVLPECIIRLDEEILTIESFIVLYNEYKELNPKNTDFDEFMEWLTWRQRLKNELTGGANSE